MSLFSKVVFLFLVLVSYAAYGQDEVFELQNATMIPHFLANPLVVEELDLTYEQEDVYNDVMRDLRKELASYASRAGDAQVSDPALFERLRSEYRENLMKVSDSFTGELMPHQRKRLSQVFLRFRTRRMKPGENFKPEILVMIDGDIPGIKLSGKQNSEIREKLSKQREEWIALLEKHRQEIRDLALEHEGQLLESLTDEQRRGYDEALGPTINFSEAFIPKRKAAAKRK